MSSQKMSNADNVYTPPSVISGNDIPAGVLNYLNGEDLLSKTQALRLTTVDADGWPKAALLSAGDVLALPNRRLRFAIFAGSGTAANLLRDGRLTLSMSLDGGMCSLRMRARKCGQGADHLCADLCAAQDDFPRGGRRQRALHARAGRHCIDPMPVWRLRQIGGHARTEHAAWPRLREDRHCRRRECGSVRSQPGDVGDIGQGESRGGCNDPAESIGEPAADPAGQQQASCTR
jgi:hypothetical protein